MSSSSININLSLPITMGSQDEVWGHDGEDFFEGSDPLVRVVKPLGIYPGTYFMFRLIFCIVLVRAYSNILPPRSLSLLLRFSAFT